MSNNCNNNFLSPTGFRLDFPGFDQVGFTCTEATLPGISMGGPTQATPLNDFMLTGDKLNYQNLVVKFLIDEDLTNYSMLHNWMVGITYPQYLKQWQELAESLKAKDFTEANNYEQLDCVLSILNSNYNTITTVKYVSAFPVDLTGVTFSTEQTDVVYATATATFAYNYYEIQNKNGTRITL
jgi:hypothetical protein